MRKVISTLCALLMSAVLFHINSANAHDTTTDSETPVELGSVFQFPVSDKVTRQVCPKVEHIEMALTDIAKMTSRRAHHFLFHDAVRREGTGTQQLKRGYSRKTEQVIVNHCKGLGPTKFAPVEVIREMDIHGYKVSIVAIYESYKDKEGIFYTYFVNTSLIPETFPTALQRPLGKDHVLIGKATRLPRRFAIFQELDLVEKILNSAERQPKPVGKSVIQNPLDTLVEYKVRTHLHESIEKGWVQYLKEGGHLVFNEFLVVRQIHGVNVSLLSSEITTDPGGDKIRFYTWVVDTEIIDPKSKRQALVK